MSTTTPSQNGSTETSFLQPPPKQSFPSPPRILVIGAGSRGTSYASAALSSTNALVVSVCEPNEYKRASFGQKFIWGPDSAPAYGAAFPDWRDWIRYEKARRESARTGQGLTGDGGFAPVIVDTVFVCVLDEMHEEVVCAVAELGGVHVCVEKPLGTRLESCLRMVRALNGVGGVKEQDKNGAVVNGESERKETVFGICHVLRYSPHNMMLRHLLLEKKVIGDVLSIEHVEPVGWWHFSHSYVRGNWRKESATAPSLLTKSCHDIDFLMWLLCTPVHNAADTTPHLPSYITSTGSRKFFRQTRKPKQAGSATNCLSCAHEPDCDYSAKKIYVDKHLAQGNTGWPVKIVNPEIEDILKKKGMDAAKEQLLKDLGDDYIASTPSAEVEARPWFGRCVFEADNDVCDDQCVTITWDDDPLSTSGEGTPELGRRGAKTAQFHMVAFTEKICERRGRIYGTEGEIEYDSSTIKVHNFSTGHTQTYTPHMEGGGHGGGDTGLVRQFLMAVNAVDSGTMPAAKAQREFLGCDLEEAFRSHAMVFAAEEARTERKVVDWKKWWGQKVEGELLKR
ncbi:streptomycin biosynthesis protein StrI [Paraphoma chrysanthemicola]|uniref:Streptomycin biosynthesis protein StrI n=1 Tax=Paraphoma chrysanthemicola TaxID=798071 RepID=A0A8K0R774_9PLEO|nr:streptomycin biosynthesis protein StrI [Paraphoma chrysanthemicola]